MAWIESHTVLMRHRKLRELAREARLRPSHTMGHLHSLWHAALDQQEDGDLSSWTDEFIADQSDYPGDAPQWVRLLQKHGWLDGKMIHDWLDYVDKFLISKYSTSNRGRLQEIWKKHGRTYGKASGKRVNSDHKANTHNQPTSTNPDQPNQPTKDPPTPPFDTPAFRKSWADFQQMRREKHKPLTATSVSRLFADFSRWGVSKSVLAIEESIKNGWLGVFNSEEERGKKNGHHSAATARVDR